MSIYAPTVDYLWKIIECYGIDPEPLFRSAGIDPEARANPALRIPREKARQLLVTAHEATGDPAFGVRYINCFHPSHLGALGYSWLSSSSLRSALEKVSRFCRAINDNFVFVVTSQKDELHVAFYHDGTAGSAPVNNYGTMALLLHLCRLIAGPGLLPLRVDFLAGEPTDTEPFDRHFRCPMQFNQEMDTMLLSRTDADRELSTAHPELSRVQDELVVRYLANRDRNDIVSQVKAAIFNELPRGEISAETVAANLNLSARNLRRRLVDKGTRFSSLLSDERFEMAKHYLRDETLSLTEIAYLLGYSAPSAFSRAFKSRTGKSPTAARQSHKSHLPHY